MASTCVDKVDSCTKIALESIKFLHCTRTVSIVLVRSYQESTMFNFNLLKQPYMDNLLLKILHFNSPPAFVVAVVIIIVVVMYNCLSD